MNAVTRAVLRSLHLYYPLHAVYRRARFELERARIRRAFGEFEGGGLTCNACGASYSRFAPSLPAPADRPALEKYRVVAGYGDDALCPGCLSNARERLVIAMLGTMDLRGKRVLHLSPERVLHDYLKGRALVTTADLEPGFYRSIDRGVHQADITRLPYEADAFDMVIANHVLEHVPDDRRAMREVCRVLTRGGRAILQVPFSTAVPATIEDPAIRDPLRQSRLFGDPGHVRVYRLDDYLARLRETGFAVEYVPFETLTAFHRYALQPGEGFVSATKP